MTDEKKPYVFIRNDEESGAWILCGELPPAKAKSPLGAAACFNRRADLMKGIGERVLSEIYGDMGVTDSDQFQLSVKVMELTKAEVDALPED